MRRAGLRSYRNATRHSGPTQVGGASCFVVVIVVVVVLYIISNIVGSLMYS